MRRMEANMTAILEREESMATKAKRKRKPGVTVEFEPDERAFIEETASLQGGRSMGSYLRELVRREMAREGKTDK